MSLSVTEIMITFLAGEMCKEDMVQVQHRRGLSLTALNPLSSPDSVTKTRLDRRVKKFCLFPRHWIKSISMTKTKPKKRRSLPPAEQATSQEMNYFICRHGVPHECTRIHTDGCSDGSRWRHINPSKVTVRQIHSTKEKPETVGNEQRKTHGRPSLP